MTTNDKHTTETAHMPDKPMPLHNLLIHVTGYADRGCAACDWLRERGYIPALPTRDCHECGTPLTLCGHRRSPSSEPCSYATSTADYCHAHDGHLADSGGRCDVSNPPGVPRPRKNDYPEDVTT